MPQAARTFRIFVSSTFNDLKAERNALQEYVYPRLKELCERAGTRFQAIDLRWGVSEEAALDQQTINICLTEIDRSRDTSPRPNFVVLLGDRYGWRPPPPHILAQEFAAIREQLSTTDEALVEKWYLRDENAVPPEYVLREREDEYEQFEKWEPVERDLAAALRGGAQAIGLRGEELMKYVASATEQEIERGALTFADAREHVFCFFRAITNLDKLVADIPAKFVERPTPETPLAEDFVDLRHPEADRTLDAEAGEKLADLKQRLHGALPGNVAERYKAEWNGQDISTDHIGDLPKELDESLKLNDAESPPHTLCVDVWLRLSRVILDEIDKLEEMGDVEQEVAAHESFGKERAKSFTGRSDVLKRIVGYVGGANPHPLALHGVSGSGKSALIARAAEQARDADRDAVLVRRFIGATPESSDGRALLESLCREISREYREDETAPADYRELVEELPERLKLAETKQRPLIVFLDALDQLSDADGARSLIWLPAKLPANVRIVVSTLRADTEPGKPAPKGSECFMTLKGKLSDDNLIDLEPMTKDEGDNLLELWLKEAGRPIREARRGEGAPKEKEERRRSARTLSESQRAEVLGKFEHEGLLKGLPLYLKLAFEEARRWHSYTDAKETKLTPGIPGIIRENLFERLSREEYHGEILVSRSLAYLGAAKNGLSEDELLDVLSEQEEILEDFKRRQPMSPDVKRLPVVVWSRLYFDLEPYLGERSADGAALMSFYHRQLGEVVADDYLVEDAERLAQDDKRELHDGRARHRELACHFEDQPLQFEGGGKRIPNLRKMSELPYQQTYGEMWDELFDTLTDFEFLERKATDYGVVTDVRGEATTYTGVYSLQEDYALALERMPGNGGGERGGRRRIIVTGTDLGHGLQVRCPHCNEFSDWNEEWRAKEENCPHCDGPWKVNDFVVPRGPAG